MSEALQQIRGGDLPELDGHEGVGGDEVRARMQGAAGVQTEPAACPGRRMALYEAADAAR